MSPEGNATIFKVELESSQTIFAKIPYGQIGAIANAVKYASGLMNSRLQIAPQLAASAVYDLVQSAQRPERFDMFTDPVTSELVFAYQYLHSAPMALRVDPETCLTNMALAMRMIRAAMN